MGRRHRGSTFDALAALPWPLALVAGLIGYFAVRYGIAWWLSQHGGLLAQGFAQRSDALFAPLAWMLLGVCWLAALVSYLGARRRRRFLDTRTSLESLAAGGWRQFEQLVADAFRRQGYSVEETGQGGPDGGIDMILRKDGRRTLVQCKQWKRQQVGVSVRRPRPDRQAGGKVERRKGVQKCFPLQLLSTKGSQQIGRREAGGRASSDPQVGGGVGPQAACPGDIRLDPGHQGGQVGDLQRVGSMVVTAGHLIAQRLRRQVRHRAAMIASYLLRELGQQLRGIG
ncbi:restriction endonuclease [Xanthomonas oryzae]|uniref:restriction endonuclease n=1 Tax=Xanthomonas oryzae TaxID=347 RepID=UPI001F5E5EAE|nr:restriction endonuclease [Xanthomonas oryzae]